MRRQLNKIVLDHKDVQIMLLISNAQPLVEIADRLAMRQPSLTERLQKLEREGFLESQTVYGVKHVKIMYRLTQAAIQIISRLEIQIHKFD